MPLPPPPINWRQAGAAGSHYGRKEFGGGFEYESQPLRPRYHQRRTPTGSLLPARLAGERTNGRVSAHLNSGNAPRLPQLLSFFLQPPSH